MGSFLSFHIKTSDANHLKILLKEFSGLNELSISDFPEYMLDDVSTYSAVEPSIIAMIEKPNGWISLYHNTFSKLHHWGEFFSKIFKTSCIQIIGQTNSEYYYFSLFEQGELKREIEADSMEGEILMDTGTRFSFEKDPLLLFDDPDHYFNMDKMEEYCSHFGLEVELDFEKKYSVFSRTSNTI